MYVAYLVRQVTGWPGLAASARGTFPRFPTWKRRWRRLFLLDGSARAACQQARASPSAVLATASWLWPARNDYRRKRAGRGGEQGLTEAGGDAPMKLNLWRSVLCSALVLTAASSLWAATPVKPTAEELA